MKNAKIGDKFKIKDMWGNEAEYTITSKRGANAYNENQPKTQEEMDRFSQPQNHKRKTSFW